MISTILTGDVTLLQMPKNIANYWREHSCNIAITLCNTDAINGYGTRLSASVTISRYAEWCTRKSCKFHSLFNNPDDESKCNRHSLERGYVEVFSWLGDSNNKGQTLEQSFQMFIEKGAGQ